MNSRRKARRGQRRGAALVELAILLPLLIGFMLASVEFCGVINHQQAVQAAAHEAARLAARRTGTNKNAKEMAEDMLDQRGVRKGKVRVSPQNVERLPPGAEITINVDAPYKENTWLTKFRLYPSENMSAEVVVVKQY